MSWTEMLFGFGYMIGKHVKKGNEGSILDCKGITDSLDHAHISV